MINQTHCYRLLGLLALGFTVSCSTPLPIGPSPDEIYDSLHRQGARDAVSLLKQGLTNRMQYGSGDPYMPIRYPEVIVPIWVPARTDPRTNRRIEGHWEHTVLKDAAWAHEE